MPSLEGGAAALRLAAHFPRNAIHELFALPLERECAASGTIDRQCRQVVRLVALAAPCDGLTHCSALGGSLAEFGGSLQSINAPRLGDLCDLLSIVGLGRLRSVSRGGTQRGHWLPFCLQWFSSGGLELSCTAQRRRLRAHERVSAPGDLGHW